MEDEQSYQQILEFTRAKAMAKAKETARNNKIIIALLLVLSVAVGFAVYSYYELNNTKAALSTANTRLNNTNDRLKTSEAELQLKTKVLDSVVASIRHTNARQDSLINLAARSPAEARRILAPVIRDRDSAREYSKLGYRLLKQKDFAGAQKAFQASENAYNGYRDSYEVSFILRKNKKNLNDPAVQTRVLDQIYNQYNSRKMLQSTDIK